MERGIHGEMKSGWLGLSVESGARGWRCKVKSLVVWTELETAGLEEILGSQCGQRRRPKARAERPEEEVPMRRVEEESVLVGFEQEGVVC